VTKFSKSWYKINIKPSTINKNVPMPQTKIKMRRCRTTNSKCADAAKQNQNAQMPHFKINCTDATKQNQNAQMPQNKISLYTYPSIPLVLLGSDVHDNLQLGLIQGHEAEVEAGEEARQELKDDDTDDHEPEGQHERVHLHLGSKMIITFIFMIMSHQ
jgi:hypothetical protein